MSLSSLDSPTDDRCNRNRDSRRRTRVCGRWFVSGSHPSTCTVVQCIVGHSNRFIVVVVILLPFVSGRVDHSRGGTRNFHGRRTASGRYRRRRRYLHSPDRSILVRCWCVSKIGEKRLVWVRMERKLWRLEEGNKMNVSANQE